jgi:1,4-dihydroxy-2-naphthoate octaprenyltransferase
MGILPLILGFILAWRWGYKGPPGLYLLSSGAAILIMWMTYALGEWNDRPGDLLNRDFNRFSGGSRVLVEGGGLPPWAAILFAVVCLAGAILLGLSLYFLWSPGPWTLPLGGIGIVCGFFYSNRPFRFSYRGMGEVLVGFCYGWLPIATGFYLLTGFFDDQVSLLSIPVGLSVFNVILMNEFPDEEADRAVGKKNLLVRFGREKAADLYLGLSVLTGLSFLKVLSILGSEPFWLWMLAGIPLLLIAWNFILMWKGVDAGPKILNALCRNGLLANLTITMVLTVQQTVTSPVPGR